MWRSGVRKILANIPDCQIVFKIQSLNDFVHDRINSVELNRFILQQYRNKISWYKSPRKLKFSMKIEFKDQVVEFLPLYIAEWIDPDNKYFIKHDSDSDSDSDLVLVLREYHSEVFDRIILLFMINNVEDMDEIITDWLHNDPNVLQVMLQLTECLELHLMQHLLIKFVDAIDF